jgi:hypothetical protein
MVDLMVYMVLTLTHLLKVRKSLYPKNLCFLDLSRKESFKLGILKVLSVPEAPHQVQSEFSMK